MQDIVTASKWAYNYSKKSWNMVLRLMTISAGCPASLDFGLGRQSYSNSVGLSLGVSHLRPATLGIQIAQSGQYSCTLGPEVSIICILGALGLGAPLGAWTLRFRARTTPHVLHSELHKRGVRGATGDVEERLHCLWPAKLTLGIQTAQSR